MISLLLDEPMVARPTALLAAQEIFFRFGHRVAYDFVTLRLLLNESGFDDVPTLRILRGTAWGSY